MMRKARVYMNEVEAGILAEQIPGKKYFFIYADHYVSAPISLAMPVRQKVYEFESFPAFFDGLLPEGLQLEGLLRNRKIDKSDLFSQLIAVGGNLVGAVTVKEIKDA